MIIIKTLFFLLVIFQTNISEAKIIFFDISPLNHGISFVSGGLNGIAGGKAGVAVKNWWLARKAAKGLALEESRKTTEILIDQLEYVGASEVDDASGKIIQKTFANELPTLEGEVSRNFKRFAGKIPANSKSSVVVEILEDGTYKFTATSPGRVVGSRAVYEKFVNSAGETIKYIKTTYGPNGSIISIKPKF